MMWADARLAASRLASPLWTAAAAGLVIGKSCAWPALWPLTLAALVLWCGATLRCPSPTLRALLLAVGAVTWSFTGMHWVMAAVRLDSDARLLWQGATLAVVATHHALCMLIAWSVAWRLTRQSDSAWVVAWQWCFAVAAGEGLQQLGWFGHGYASLATALVEAPGARQLLPVLGAPGWTALVALTCAGAAMAVRARSLRPAPASRAAWTAPVLALATVVTVGAAAWPTLPSPLSNAAPVPILLLQKRVHTQAQWTPEIRDASVDLLRTAMAEVPRGGVVVTPETYFAGVPPNAVSGQWADLMGLAAQRSVTALIGMPNVFHDGQGLHGMNSVTQLAPSRVSVYGKERLVPFAEYLPWPTVLGFFYRHVFASAKEVELPAPPELRQALYVQGRSVGVMICHELSFSATVATRADSSDWLVSLSDDGWVGDGDYLAQMSSIARVRALETGKPVLRVASGGPSYLVDPNGRVLHVSSGDNTPMQLIQLTPRVGTTPFVAYAATLPWMYLLLLLSPALLPCLPWPRQPRPTVPEDQP